MCRQEPVIVMGGGRYIRGMPDVFSGTARDIFHRTAEAMRNAIDGAPSEVRNRKPGASDTNSITVLAVHMMHSTRSWLCVATGAPLPARNRDDEFVATMPDAASLLEFFDGMVADCRAILNASAVTDWSATARTHARPQPAEDGEVPAAWALLHALEHLGEHTGQIQLTRQLLDTDWSPPES
jgi:uncharacterized damage-inducible protein DinB